MTVILTVEDEFLVSDYLGSVLHDAGHQVIAAGNADEAIAVLEARDDIGIIITDINMPGSMDGLRLAAAVRDRWPPIKIIIVTGKDAPGRHEMPADSLFLAKPYKAETIVGAVAQLRA
jgi:CheY-like chemotaxis protein